MVTQFILQTVMAAQEPVSLPTSERISESTESDESSSEEPGELICEYESKKVGFSFAGPLFSLSPCFVVC